MSRKDDIAERNPTVFFLQSSKFVGGRQAITVLLAFCCSLYPKLAEMNLLMPFNEPSIVALTLT